ncbi:F-box/WD-40 repeat-containing protein [Pseudoneurospora amorphoporcata]|uniref:F-box/WD-40 repeat-containing protein n=1 Tax=Pseudoneurospora amorphoporcata TaxID=241081 RepID=A0AAN6NWI7_9PEZI|nr:F-box/WD-40 repeat-containing protein [Pseudoneurospora amorphoporcata]
MAGFPPHQQHQHHMQPDEGYSEDPLNPQANSSCLKSRDASPCAHPLSRQASDIPPWLIQHISGLSMENKTGWPFFPPFYLRASTDLLRASPLYLELAMALLNDLPTSVISQIVETQLYPRLYIDFVRYLPAEICLKILGYLDPVSLINVARACRVWYELAMDRKLWQHLYYMEGFKALMDEIHAAEEEMNQTPIPTPSHLEQYRPEEDGHVHKRRAIAKASPPMLPAEEDTNGDEPSDIDMAGSSIFGGGGGSGVSRSRTSEHSEVNGRGRRADKGKGRAMSPPPQQSATTRYRDNMTHKIPVLPGTLQKTTMWWWDANDRRYKIDWKYLYTMRRRLEANWEHGKYTNFQLPHPDYPDEGHRECIYSIQYNPQYLVSGSRDLTIKVWDMKTRRCLRTLKGHRRSVLCLQFDSSPDEDIIVSGSSDSDVIIWRFSTGEIIEVIRHAHQESVLNVKFDKRILVTCSKDKTIKVFNRKPLRQGDLGYPISPVGTTVNVGYNIPPSIEDAPVIAPWTMIGSLTGHSAAVNAVQIHEREIVSASGDRYIKVWDWPTQEVQRTIIGHHKGIACVQYDGRRIVSGSSDNEVKIFDCQTGLEITTLRGHTALVRTVQAGFGDHPYSAEEDLIKAKKVDEAYYKAVEAGEIDENDNQRTRRKTNAGSSKPQDICATGAKLPPGGGGGRFGRIVSGSYDTTIIIWRRDSEGVWRPQHHLRHEQAAEAASRQDDVPPDVPGRIPLHPTMRSSLTAASMPAPIHPHIAAGSSRTASAPPGPVAGTRAPETMDPATLLQYEQMVNGAVQSGPSAFRNLLQTRPEIISLRHMVDRAINRQSDQDLRTQLRHAWTGAHIHNQWNHGRIRSELIRNQENVMAANAPTAAAAAAAAAGGSNGVIGSSTTTATATPTAAAATLMVGAATGQPVIPQVSLPQVLVAPADAITAPAAPAAQQPQLPPMAGGRHHPHIPIAPAEENSPRVFKLQYDARRIICCSQTSFIVGWDFCNGDKELEEATRFFDTVR